MTHKLRISDFRRIESGIPWMHYYSFLLRDGREICLEACMEGYCVAIYERPNGEIIGEKTCTKMGKQLEAETPTGFPISSAGALEKALQIANSLL